jgi:NAD(P)-dependent dehydrogenase (short-subunit alcohol dehydrogenase family)
MGLRVAIADRVGPPLQRALAELVSIAAGGPEDVIAVACDVSRPQDLARLAEETDTKLGDVSFLMNNAGVGANPGRPWENLDAWQDLMSVNFWGVVHGVQAFAPAMLAAGRPGMIVNTGSKQGITTPPGNLAYNVSKAAVKTYTEGLAHALRNEPGAMVSAHLLIPGFTYTGMTQGATSKPAGAWTPDQVVDFMLESLGRGDFYILCPDNETERSTDEKRMAWAIGDIIENRPALSRWHPDHAKAFADFLKRE